MGYPFSELLAQRNLLLFIVAGAILTKKCRFVPWSRCQLEFGTRMVSDDLVVRHAPLKICGDHTISESRDREYHWPCVAHQLELISSQFAIGSHAALIFHYLEFCVEHHLSFARLHLLFGLISVSPGEWALAFLIHIRALVQSVSVFHFSI